MFGFSFSLPPPPPFYYVRSLGMELQEYNEQESTERHMKDPWVVQVLSGGQGSQGKECDSEGEGDYG